MRSHVFLSIAATCSSFALQAAAQSDADTSLQQAVDRYVACVEAGDMRGALDMVHPVLFKAVDKEVLLEHLAEEQARGMDDVRFANSRVNRITGPLTQGDMRFALVHYSFTTVMPLERDSAETGGPMPDEEQKGSDELVISMMEAMYGDGNVTWEPSTRMLSINMKKAMYAILDPAIGEWRFLEKKEDMRFVEEVIPRKVLRKLDM